MKKHLILDGSDLKISDVTMILHGNLDIEVEISPKQIQAIVDSRSTVDIIVSRRLPIYGISTGFGKFKEVYIPHNQQVNLQKNLIISHAACVGEPLEPKQVLLMMILRLNCLIRGWSGVRLELLKSLEEAINKQIIPKVPRQGSVGASGDLAPLSHLALGLMGIGQIWDGKQYIDAEIALEAKNFEPMEYMEKEGLAMNNGTQMMTALNIEGYYKATQIAKCADIALALTAFATQSNLHSLLCQDESSLGKKTTLNTIKQLLNENDGSNGVNAKSIQCAINAHGIVHESLNYAKCIIQREMNSTSDNPIIDNEFRNARSGGNFHGEYMAQVADMLCIALQRLCIFSERRQERLVNSEIGQCELPMFLTERGGILNGYMIPQYTSAAITSENKVLSNPSCIDTIPTSANIEDHVSMGAFSARKLLTIAKNVEYVVAIEIMCACQAIDIIECEQIPEKIEKIRKYIRDIVPDIKYQDIFMSHYIELVKLEIENGNIANLIE